MPVLALLLLLALGAAAWWLYALNFGPAGKPPSFESVLNTQAANVQARKALAGDPDGFAALRNTATALKLIKTANMSPGQRSQLGAVRTTVDDLLEGQGGVREASAAAQRVANLVDKFTETVYTLQGNGVSPGDPALIANIERLRLLANAIAFSAAGMVRGDTNSAQVLVDSERELQQIVRALQVGEPQLGIIALTGADATQAMPGLTRRAEQLGASISELQKQVDMLQPLNEALTQLDKLALAMEGDLLMLANPAVGSQINAEIWRLFALLGAAAFIVLIMLVLWYRASDQRQKTAQLAAATERDQQAILRLLDELSSLADGDLTVQATVGEDITGAIADSVNFAVEALRDLVATINKGAILVGDATKQTETSARSLAEASDAQARQIKHATEAIQQMAASIDEVSGNAERSADVARHSVDIAHKGGDAVRRTIEGMNTIRETIQETSKRIKRLGESSQEIGDIVELINDIADQTNILALNASIQASMAGEAGRGFAVVADEVQRLAERSANATKQIEVLVSTIQADTNEAVVSMERSTTDVVGGALLAENAGAALEEIEQVSNQIAMLVHNISSSAREQSGASKSVLESAEQLQSISVETEASAAATTNYIDKLGELATQLRESVAGFVLPNESGGINAEADAHHTMPSAEHGFVSAGPEEDPLAQKPADTNEPEDEDKVLTNEHTA